MPVHNTRIELFCLLLALTLCLLTMVGFVYWCKTFQLVRFENILNSTLPGDW